MSASQDVARTLVECIPPGQHSQFLQSLSQRLHDQADFSIAGVVACLLEGINDRTTEDRLYEFLLIRIAKGDVQPVAQFCCSHHQYGERVLSRVIDTLCTWAQAKSLDQEENSFLLPWTSLQWLPNLSQNDNLQDMVVAVSSPSTCLSYVLALCQSASPAQSVAFPPVLVKTLLVFLFATDSRMNQLARDSLFTYLRLKGDQKSSLTEPSDDEGDLFEDIWSCVVLLLDNTKRTIDLSNASQLWLRWLDLIPPSHTIASLLNTDTYWDRICAALAVGDFERRKVALHILRKSIMLASERGIVVKCDQMEIPNTSAKGNIQADFDRYCVVYETINVGRYLNQARECIDDLDYLASDRTSIAKSWLYALMTPALTWTMSDGIQKLVGSWLMRANLHPDNHDDKLAHLLLEYVLPWATQGLLFTGSVVGSAAETRCGHAERLSLFLASTLRTYARAGYVSQCALLVRSMLHFLNKKKNAMVPIASVFVLDGIVQGLVDEQKIYLGQPELLTILEISRVTALPQVAEDAIVVRCSQLIGAYAPLSSKGDGFAFDNKSLQSQIGRLENEVSQLRLIGTTKLQTEASESQNNWTSLDDLENDLRKTNYACLQGRGLDTACLALVAIFDSGPPEASSVARVTAILDAIWTEVEIQDYPRKVLQCLPRVYLHPRLVIAGLADQEFDQQLTVFFGNYRTFIQGRVYLWSPLMRALRVALDAEPQLAVHLLIEDFLLEIVNKPPTAKSEFLLDAATATFLLKQGEEYAGLTFEHYYGEHEGIGYAAFVEIINSSKAITTDMAGCIFNRLLKPWISQKLPPPGVSKWKRTEQLQIALILLHRLLVNSSIEDAKRYMSILLKIVFVEPLPRFRYLLEWTISRIVYRHRDLSEEMYEEMVAKDHHSSPKSLSTLIKLCVTVAMFDGMDEVYCVKVAASLVSLSASSKSAVRHEAQWRFPLLFNHAEEKGWQAIIGNSAFVSLVTQIRSLDIFDDPPLERRLEQLDPVNHHNLATLCSGHYLSLEPPGVIRATWDDFDRLYAQDTKRPHADQDPIGCIPLGPKTLLIPVRAPRDHGDEGTLLVDNDKQGLNALQTKGTAYLESLGETTTSSGRQSSELIVVGSLISTGYNLGGLSRASEIFGAASLTVDNAPRVLNNKDFISVAVGSQDLFPVEDVTERDLPAFLSTKKSEGYCVVGIEQTDRSVILGHKDTVFPAKTVLVLGKEKEGMPGHIMGECDMLVEIPQKGITRSLNVQTAAAAVLYEYTRQHSQGGV